MNQPNICITVVVCWRQLAFSFPDFPESLLKFALTLEGKPAILADNVICQHGAFDF